MNARDYALCVGANLRRVRQDRGWSLADVEQKSGGVHKAVVVGSYERGNRAISAGRLCVIADFYSIPVAELFPANEYTPPTVPQLLRRALAVAEQREAMETYEVES